MSRERKRYIDFIKGIGIVQVIFKLSNNKMVVCLLGVISLMVGIVLPNLSFGYPWCLDVAFLTTFFIIIGYLVKDKLEKKSKLFYLGIFVVGLLITIVATKLSSQSTEYVLLAMRRIGNPIVFVIGALGGCMMIYSLARLADSMVVHAECLSFIGSNSLTIFLVHKPII